MTWERQVTLLTVHLSGHLEPFSILSHFRSKFIRESIFQCFLGDSVFLHLTKSGSMHPGCWSAPAGAASVPVFKIRDREHKGRGLGDGHRYGGNRTIAASDFFGNMYPVRLLK